MDEQHTSYHKEGVVLVYNKDRCMVSRSIRLPEQNEQD
jgi:hypothetical protein